MATTPQSQINVGVQDAALSISQALPAGGANVTTPVLDLQATTPNSNAWRLGRIQVSIPALPENTGTGITVALQAAPPLLTAGSASIAPQTAVPGAFITPICAQTITFAGVAGGTPAQTAWFTLAFDPTGSVYQFYQFLVTTPGGTATVGEIMNIGWING
jgi:hypothetical protein